MARTLTQARRPPRSQRGVSPAAQLREQLAWARRTGMDFADAWPRSTENALRTVGGLERREWRWTFVEQEDIWRAAYNREELPFNVLELAPDS